MNNLETVEIQCPYCGETIEVIVDCSAGSQKYIEDCEVCCRPITMKITIDSEGLPIIDPSREDEL